MTYFLSRVVNRALYGILYCPVYWSFVDINGKFIAKANVTNAIGCEFCAAGRHSDDILTAKGANFICVKCAPGRIGRIGRALEYLI